MNIKTFFLCIAPMTLLFNNTLYASGGKQFGSFAATVIFVGVGIYWSGAGPEIAKKSLPQIFGGIANAATVPVSKAIGNVVKIPFSNPIDKKIEEKIKEREALSAKYNSLQQLIPPRPHGTASKDPSPVEILSEATAQQLFAVEKKITKLTEKKVFDKNRVTVIY